jgi:DNA (cytosine-5)-methyltransferase 1
MGREMHCFYEFFAGGGMARAGLGSGWNCLFANDFDHKKSKTYRDYWGDDSLITADIGTITIDDLPSRADLVWGSFPCQDLSLAGAGAGLKGDRSGTFWPFWKLVQSLIADGRAPSIITLENVCGTLTSHGGKDFSAICSALQKEGYWFGAIVVDAVLFVPHSRPRLFIIAIHKDNPFPPGVVDVSPSTCWHTPTLRRAYGKLPDDLKKHWVWWALPKPSAQNVPFSSIIEDQPACVSWHTREETNKLLNMMSTLNRAKVEEAQRLGRRVVGCIYKRTRNDEFGHKVQRAEIRFDNISGCLRTPAGGSSRQLIFVVDGETVKSRLISSRETARLMGLPEDYNLPKNYNEAYHLTGDGVVVPVVRHIAKNIFEPILFYQNNHYSEAV